MRTIEVNTWNGKTWTWAIYQLDEIGDELGCWTRGQQE